MCSTPSGALATAHAALAALPPGRAGLGSGLAEEVGSLASLAERTRVAFLERLALLDASGAPADAGCASTEAWLVVVHGYSRARANADVWLARALFRNQDRPLTTTADQLRAGRISAEAATVIARSLTVLPLETVPEAEALMLETAARVGPAQLAVVGRRLRRVLVDDEAVRAEIARGDRYLRLTPALYGMWAIDGLLDAETGAALQAGLDALLAAPTTAPGQLPLDADEATDAPGGLEAAARPTAAQRRADALGEIARGWLAAGGAPIAGGVRPQVVVTVDLATLTGTNAMRGGLGIIRPDSRTGAGSELTPDAVRRIACDAGLTVIATEAGGEQPDQCGPSVDPELLRAVLAGISPALGGLPLVPLCVGRTSRLVTTGMRLALAARDRGCVAPGCTAGPEHCDAHHVVFWTDGGSTCLANLVLLCGAHHRFVHDRHWTLHRDPAGGWTLRPPPGFRLAA